MPLEGSSNFRDLGGYPTVGGGMVRTGLVYRSDALHALTDADRTLLRSLGVRVAYDLRSDEERRAEPTAAAFLRQIHVPLVVSGPASLAEAEDGEAFLLALYQRLLFDAAGTIGSILLAMAHGDGAPAVVHCSAGKDRTGVVAAILLLALEVDEHVVLDDYELTAQLQARHRAEHLLAKLTAAGLPAALVGGLLGTPRAALAESLATLRRRYGSIEHYLLSAAGLLRDDLLALRLRLRTT